MLRLLLLIVSQVPVLVIGQNWMKSHRSFFELQPAPLRPGELTDQGPSRGSTDFSDVEIEAIVERHNQYRRTTRPEGANLRHMQWDGTLATMAQDWANYCNFEHGGFEPNISPFESVGQNLYVASEGSVQAESAVVATDKWHDEEQDYNYDYDSCSGVCGHYTQVVWARTYTVGCGRKRCGRVSNVFFNDPSYIIVCNYGPAGNYHGERPFALGPRCSDCEKEAGFCFNDLCRDCSGANFVNGCECNLQCQNCGTLNEAACTCACAPGWDGSDCSKPCEDHHEWCNVSPGWPGPDYCDFSPEVPRFCRKMCGLCSRPDSSFRCGSSGGQPEVDTAQEADCEDSTTDCTYWANDGYCKTSDWMVQNCRKSCNTCPSINPLVPTTPPQICEDSNQDCSYWARIGECDANPSWMLQNCMVSCDVCVPTGDGGGTNTGDGGDGGGTNTGDGGNQGGAGGTDSGGNEGGDTEKDTDETPDTPAYCNIQFTEVTTINGELYCFKGAKLWRFSRVRQGRLMSPVEGEDTKRTFPKVSLKMKAAYQRRDDKVIFIKGDKIWASTYKAAKDAWIPDHGYPRRLAELYSGLPTNPSSAFYDAYEDRSYFFKGSYVWRLNEYRQQVDLLKARMKNWFKGVPTTPTGAFQDVNGDTIFLKDSYYYRVPYQTKAVSGEAGNFASTFLSGC